MSSLSTAKQLDLAISSPMQMAWVHDGNLYIVTTDGVLTNPVPGTATAVDLDIMEMSQSQPELLIKFDNPAVASYISGDMSSLVVVQLNKVQGSLVLLTVCTVNWTVREVSKCPCLEDTGHPLWVCCLPTQWVPPGQLLQTTAAQLYVVAAGGTAVITDGKTSCQKQLDCQTRGQFFSQFLARSAPGTNISSLTSLASILQQEQTGELSCRLLCSSVMDLVMVKGMLAILTKEGVLWKMNRQSGQFQSQPLISCVESIALVGEVLTAVTRDKAVYMFNMMQEELVVENGKMKGLKMRNKGDILEKIVEEAKSLDSLARDTAVVKDQLQQLQIFQQLLLAESAQLFQTELCVAAVSIFSEEKCLKASFKNVSDFKLLGKFWSLKLDISLSKDKCTLAKTVSLPSSFPGQETVSCVLPLPPTAASHLPLTVRSYLVFRGHALGGGLVPSLPLGTNKVTVLDMLSLTGVGLGTKKVVTDKEYFYRSLGGESGPHDEGGCGEHHQLTLSVGRTQVAGGGKGKLEHIVTTSENNPTVWNLFEKTVKISSKSEDKSDSVHVTLASDNISLLRDIRNEIEQDVER